MLVRKTEKFHYQPFQMDVIRQISVNINILEKLMQTKQNVCLINSSHHLLIVNYEFLLRELELEREFHEVIMFICDVTERDFRGEKSGFNSQSFRDLSTVKRCHSNLVG